MTKEIGDGLILLIEGAERYILRRFESPLRF